MIKPVYICERHEMALYYWFKAKEDFGIEDAFFIITMDAHNDLLSLTPDVINEIRELNMNNLCEIKDFVWRPRPENKLTYRQFFGGMEAGLIGDILIISPDCPQIKIYPNLGKQKHRIFHCTHPNNLKDLFARDQTLKKSIGYPRGKSNLVLDIDLDFFTYDDDRDERRVINEDDFKNIFSSDSLIWWVYEKARLITVSKESYWCGGIDNSERIFKLLETYFFHT